MEVVGSEFNLDTVAREDADVVHAHFAADVREHLGAVLQLHTKHGVGERLDDGALEDDRIFLGLCQDENLPDCVEPVARTRNDLGDPGQWTTLQGALGPTNPNAH